jgi:hypothetical protein
MQTGDLKVKIELDNGIWLCDCTETADKKGTPYYHVSITPPKGYPVTVIDPVATPITFKYITEMMEFNFGKWPFKEQEYRDELESELSAVIVAQITEQ